MLEKHEQLTLDVAWRGAEMRIGEDVARRREHAHSLPKARHLYKRIGSTHFRARCSSMGTSLPIANSQVVSED
jgi:hypothetical protein